MATTVHGSLEGIAYAIAILAGAWLAWRWPRPMGWLLIVIGAILALLFKSAIDFGKGWSESPSPWGFWDFFFIAAVGGVPVLAGILFLLSAWVEDRAETRRADFARRSR